MPRISRRRLLYLLGGVAGVLLLARLSNLWPWINWIKVAVLPRRSQKGELLPMKATPFIRNGKALVSIVHGKDVVGAVARSLQLLGSAEPLSLKGKTVLVKPNVNSDDPFPGTTNPAVVAAVVSLLYQAGAAQVIVGDCSNARYHPSVKTMEKLGIKGAAEAAGARVVGFEEGEWVEVRPRQARYLKRFSIPQLLYQVDFMVEVPVLKTHQWATYTMSLKNLVGTIHPKDRIGLHQGGNLEEGVAEISLAVHSDLIVMDGTRSMVAGGPFSGPTVDTHLIVSGADCIAVDLVGLSVVKHFSQWPRVSDLGVWEQRQIKRAMELELGVTRGEDIELMAEALPDEDGEAFSALVSKIKGFVGIGAA